MKSLKIIISFLLILSFTTNGFAQIGIPKKVDWELVKDEGNIQVFTRTPEDEKLKEIRIIAEFKMDVDSLMFVLNDANRYTDWVYKCNESRVISILNEDEFYYYVTSDLPFPASDRDLIVRCKQWTDKDGVVYSQSVAQPDMIPDKEGFVRIRKYISNWKISPRPDGIVHIDYNSVSDPGGSIPAWIINLAMTAGPLKTMRQLEKVASNAEYVLNK